MVVRRIVGVRGGRALFSDALGELVSLTETDLTLSTPNGTLRVPLDEIHRAKRVPPTRRPTAAAVIALELAANEAWPAPIQDRLGGWLLRAAGGWTGRGNSALPIGDPDRPLEQAVDAVVRWYADRDLTPRVNVPLPLAAPVNTELDARGWTTLPLNLVQTAPLTTVVDAATPRRDLPPVHLDLPLTDDWLAVASDRRGPPPPIARHLLTNVEKLKFARVYGESGETLAVARATITGQGQWLGLSLIDIRPQSRRQGLAQHLIRAVTLWAREEGATRAFLQVEERNAAAVALYSKLGFTTHHTYLTRVAP